MKKKEPKLISEFYELKVRQLMDKKIWDLPLINKDAPMDNVLSILDGRTHVWVLDNENNNELLGVITQHDVLHVLAPPRQHYNVFSVPKTYTHNIKGKAEDIMVHNPIICRENDKIVDVLQKMIRQKVRRLPVVAKNNNLVGEITLGHLIHKYYMASQYHPILDNK